MLEQIAGLLHDISHTVFSHVADYVFSDGSGAKQNFQDNVFKEFIKKSEIPAILKKHKINYKDILDNTKFPLKERELPDLCADRIDYFLRELRVTNKATLKEIRKFIGNFTIIDDFWVFKNKALAKKYAYLFLKINNWFWAGLESAVMFKTTGDLIKYALKNKIITKNDLFTTDKAVWAKIKPVAAKDDNLKILVDRADNRYKFKLSGKGDYDLHTFCKSRVVDPLFFEDQKLKRVSQIDLKFFKLKEKHFQPKEYYIKFLKERG